MGSLSSEAGILGNTTTDIKGDLMSIRDYVKIVKETVVARCRKALCSEIKLVGHVEAVLRDKNGNVKQRLAINNLVVNTGKNWFAKVLAGESFNSMTHMAIGTSSTSASASQTALVGTELGRVAVDSKTRTDNAVAVVATFPAGTGTGTVNEAGIFDASSSGTMLARVVFSGAVTKAADDELQVSWTITIG